MFFFRGFGLRTSQFSSFSGVMNQKTSQGNVDFSKKVHSSGCGSWWCRDEWERLHQRVTVGDQNKVAAPTEKVTVTRACGRLCERRLLHIYSFKEAATEDTELQHFPVFLFFSPLSLPEGLQTHPRLNHFISSRLPPSFTPSCFLPFPCLLVQWCCRGHTHPPSAASLSLSLWPWEVLQRAADSAAVPTQESPPPLTLKHRWKEQGKIKK